MINKSTGNLFSSVVCQYFFFCPIGQYIWKKKSRKSLLSPTLVLLIYIYDCYLSSTRCAWEYIFLFEPKCLLKEYMHLTNYDSINRESLIEDDLLTTTTSSSPIFRSSWSQPSPAEPYLIPSSCFSHWKFASPVIHVIKATSSKSYPLSIEIKPSPLTVKFHCSPLSHEP